MSQTSTFDDTSPIGQGDERQPHERGGHGGRQREPDDLADWFGHPREGHHELRERRQILVLVVAVIRPVEGLVGEEANGGGSRYGEVDKLVAVQAHEAVSSSDDEHDHHRTHERPLTDWHAASVSHSFLRRMTIC